MTKKGKRFSVGVVFDPTEYFDLSAFDGVRAFAAEEPTWTLHPLPEKGRAIWPELLRCRLDGVLLDSGVARSLPPDSRKIPYVVWARRFNEPYGAQLDHETAGRQAAEHLILIRP